MDDDTARGSEETGDSSTASRTDGFDAERPATRDTVRFDERTAVPERSRAKSGTVYLVGAGPGDPNHSGYQFVGKVERAVDAPVTVIPGISSLQIAASRARTPMEDAEFVTLHKSGDLDADRKRLTDAVGDRHLLVLPRPFDWMPGDVAELLAESGADPGLDAPVLERLTHEDERITRTTLDELRASVGGSDRESTPYSDLSVLVVRAEVP